MNELALFAGAGGGILGGKLLGWTTVCAVEWEPYPASVLVARQNEGLLPPFPIWDDVRTFDGNPWRGLVDVISGGFPCQDISAAGKGAGITGERSGMWKEMARIIGEVRPRYVFVENSPMLTIRGLGTVLGNLSEMGFDAEWGVISASDVGANHQRDRIWIRAEQRDFLSHSQHNGTGWWEQQPESAEEKTRIVANARCELRSERNSGDLDTQEEIGTSSPILKQSGGHGCGEDQMANTSSENAQGLWSTIGIPEERSAIGSASWWSVEPNVGRVANGVAARVDRLKAIGNGQVPLCAATAWTVLKPL